jgi:hypothetical protein
MAMAKVIKFYIPDRHKNNSAWVPPDQKGKLINFPAQQEKKSA